ncbi:MAG: HAD family hydrolase [Lachnospiraceae bacterium]|nr:HAD family hydrolase [Lachnospiraceae bacterium]
MKKKGILFFDLDGTLLDNRTDEVPASAMDAIDQLREKYVICLATGRDMDTHYSVKYKSMVRPDCIIHRNGTRITVGETDIFRHYMDKTLLRRAGEFAASNGLSVGTSIGEYDYFINPQLKTAADISYRGTSSRHFRPFDELFAEDILVSAIDFAGDVLNYKDMVERAIPEFTLYPFNSGTGADVVEKGFSKADGMKRICDYYCIPMEYTWAFGDSPNDIPMLKAAGCGVAMGNADDAVKEMAQEVTDAVWDDGIARFLRKLM